MELCEYARHANKKVFAERAVELYQQGFRVIDVAERLGFKRGRGLERVRKALYAAGVIERPPRKLLDRNRITTPPTTWQRILSWFA